MDIAIYDGEKTYFFDNWKSFLDWLSSNCSEKKYQQFIAHNGGGFDYISLTEYLKTEQKTEYEIILVQSDIIILSLKIGKINIQFYDSAKVLVHASLQSLSEQFNVEHKKIEVAYDKSDMGKFKKENEKLYFQYLLMMLFHFLKFAKLFKNY